MDGPCHTPGIQPGASGLVSVKIWTVSPKWGRSTTRGSWPSLVGFRGPAWRHLYSVIVTHGSHVLVLLQRLQGHGRSLSHSWDPTWCLRFINEVILSRPNYRRPNSPDAELARVRTHLFPSCWSLRLTIIIIGIKFNYICPSMILPSLTNNYNLL